MKLLHVIPTYLPAVRYGGPIFAVHSLCRSLVAQGHDVQVYTTTLDGPGVLDVPVGEPVNRDGVRVSYFAANGLRRLAIAPAMRTKLARTVADFDLVHIHSVFLWPPWIAARMARRHGVPYVISPRGMLVRDLIAHKSRLAKTAWLRWMERTNLRSAGAMHFTSELEHHEAARLGVVINRAAVIPNGIGIEEADAAASVPDTPELRALLAPGPFVLSLGRIHWKKGNEHLVRALRLLPKIRAIIAGNDEEGHRAALEKLATECGVLDRITFPGAIYGPAKWRLLAAARALVLPSRSENFANVVLEAMAARCPVIVSPGVGLANVVRRVGCGLVVDPQSEELAAALGTLWDNAALRVAMGASGRAAVERDFGWPKIAGDVCELYETLTDARCRT